MNKRLYERYNNYTKEDLFAIMLSQQHYEPEAVELARQVITEKNWLDELNDIFSKADEEDMQKSEEFAQFLTNRQLEKIKAAEYAADKNVYYIRISDSAIFEQALANEGIGFYSPESDSVLMVNNIPSYAYYIKDEDIKRVDTLLQTLNVLTPEADTTSSVGARNLKTMLKFLLLGLIAYFIYKKLSWLLNYNAVNRFGFVFGFNIIKQFTFNFISII